MPQWPVPSTRGFLRRGFRLRWGERSVTSPDSTSDSLLESVVEQMHRQLLDHGHHDAAAIQQLLVEHDPLLDDRTVTDLIHRVHSRVSGLGVLDQFLADPAIDEVMVNGAGDLWVERSGRLECTGIIIESATTYALLERIVAPLGLRIDRTSSLVDARLPDGSRVNGVVPPLAVDGPLITIRRFGARRVQLPEVCSPGVAKLLEWAVQSRCNIIVSGGAGAGKTTLLNAVTAFIPPDERVVTIEDTAELRLPGRHVVRLERRPPNAEGVGEVSIRDLVRNALRMRPDRIVIGEVRSGEAIDMLQAMNTGHDGSLSTCHANSPIDAIRRLETLVLMGDVALPLVAIREQLRAAVDLIVHVARQPDGSRRVVSMAEPMPDGETGSSISVNVLTGPSGELVTLPSRPRRATHLGPPLLSWVAS
ncbi:MAG: CpaF family protein [Acidimicrobiia bacterium]|nr:CpaF family protein [Acidimicrobiia bacterium]